MLCSLGHDDIQYWLMQPKNREKLRIHFGIQYNFNYDKDFVVEYRFKPKYEPEEFYDGLEWFSDGEGCDHTPYCHAHRGVLYEIKPELKDLGETLRQLRKYKSHANPGNIILIYNTSKFPTEVIKQYFDNAEIKTYQLLPNECKRLEEL